MDFPQIYRKKIIAILLALVALGAIAFFDKVLAFGLLFALFLTLATLLAFDLLGVKSRLLFALFIFALLTHLIAVLVISYTGFQPFSSGRGDYNQYHMDGKEIAGRIHAGNLSLEGISSSHAYPMMVGWLYAFTLDEMLIGQIFNAWLSALVVVMAYLVAIEIGGSRLGALGAALIVNVYPSFIFFGSLLLREALVALLATSSLLLAIKVLKKFSWLYFVIFYIDLGLLIHFRFNAGYPLLFTFIPCFLLFAAFPWKRRLVYGVAILFLFGFLPMLSGQGYYGTKPMKVFLNSGVIKFYREVAYTYALDDYVRTGEFPCELKGEPNKLPWQGEEPGCREVTKEIAEKEANEDLPLRQANVDSTFVVPARTDNPVAFVRNNLITFSYNLLGPFPWQLVKPKHFWALFETIPLFFLVLLALWGLIVNFRERYRVLLLVLGYILLTILIMALFFTNYGIIIRIRIPAVIALVCLVPLAFGKNPIRLFHRKRA